ncbi:general secretion pathway protein E [Desulfonema ishimotonii]|uniref:General secretion pathway protein E n=1 Tax=Desulfonema ishimotonii TaxID=45657 RepID=A0A401FQ60_9BACT|nr:ATPase, T2SS/T4P/T4SS family [Desulfonema ishimotonii]GBC59124.1 general secretion pathway protein E [Desulfonema ishimotonii]
MKKKLGQILVEANLLTSEDLEEALTGHKKSGMKLGQYLISKGLVSELQLVNMLSRQLKLPRYRSENYPRDESLAEILSADYAQKHQLVPVKRSGHLLTIAMTDPMDIEAMDFVEAGTDMEVVAIICTEQELNHLITNLYGDFSGITDVLDNLQFKKEAADEIEMGGSVEVSLLQDMAEEAPVVRLVNTILSQAVRDRASDVHISPEKDSVQVRFRVDGRLHEVPAPPKSMILPLISRLKILANMDIAVSRIPQDGRFTVKMNHKEINVRVSTIPTIYGENIVLRLLDTSGGIYSLKQLGMSEEDRGKTELMLSKPYGMILSTGPTGSGKTTSLYSILNKINQPDINIITLEDPVEYRIGKIRQTQLNRKAGMTFANGIRSILRQDPDVIMVGEIRDSETATIAVQAALTGHKVLSTLHTNTAAGAITRFIDMGIAPFLISSVLLLLIGQRLIRKVCPYCREAYTPPEAVLEYWALKGKAGEVNHFFQSKGCFNCFNTGYKGRTGVFEVLIIDETIQEMILDSRSAHEITRSAQDAGMLRTLKENVAGKVREGITTIEEAASVVMI